MRLLVLSRTPWRRDNSFGNTYNNFFERMPDIEIANIYLADGTPERESFVSAYYQISESEMFKTLFRSNRVGKVVDPISKLDESANDNKVIENSSLFSKAFRFAKQNRLSLFFMVREFIWKHGNVDYESLYKFVEDFNPDAFFVPVYYASYVSEMVLNLKKRFDIPLLVESAVDVYTLKQFSLDPFFWINRIKVRKTVKRIYKEADIRYLISDKQKEDYSRIFNLSFNTLYKTPDPSRCLYPYSIHNGPIRFLFTGNIGSGRWKTLGKVAKALNETRNGHLDIYTATPITKRIKKALDIEGISSLHSAVSSSDVLNLQNSADVLIHVESFGLKDRLEVRYAISTKVMDYISDERCILAIGPADIASIELFEREDAAIIVSDKSRISEYIARLTKSHDRIGEYAVKSSLASKRLQQQHSAGEVIYNDLLAVLRN